MCFPRMLSINGTSPSAAVGVRCGLRAAASGGYNLSFQIASLADSTTFEDSSEALSVAGFLPGPGQEIQSGNVTVNGLGWSVSTTMVGASGLCHVFIDSVDANGFVGRIRCPMVPDDAMPPALRTISGSQGGFGAFSFSRCGAP